MFAKREAGKSLSIAILMIGGLGTATSVCQADVVNGNFGAGNTGFTSGYTLAASDPPNVGGHYTVDSNPINFNGGGASFGDHTTGTGLMLIADGSLTSNVPVWSESIAVIPHAQYEFSFYSASWGESNGDLSDPSPANLVATANSTQVGTALNLPAPDGKWSEFSGTFNSGTLSVMPLAITDSNTTFIGNDFAIDDISLLQIPEPTVTWNNSGGAGDGKTWDVGTNQNWNNGAPAVYNQYENVIFNDANNGNYNVTLSTIVTPTSLTFANNSGNYSITGVGGISGATGIAVTGSGMVTLNTYNTYTGPTTVAGGTLVIGAAEALPAGNALTIGNGTTPATMQLAEGIGKVTVSSLAINSQGTLDITNNSLAISYVSGSSPAGAIRQLLTSGYGNDTWTGPGIDSSTAALNPGRFAIGYADGNVDQGTPAAANQVLVEYALAGDANLDGLVNFADLLVVAQNFNHTLDTHGNPIDWADGDFNYDGKVNFADLLLVAQNFNRSLSASQLEQLPGSFGAAWNLALAEVQASETNNVPEPASAGLFALAGLGLLRRRRRKLN